MIARAGFTSIWLPPPSDAVSPQGYLPRDLYSLSSAYGSEGELRELLYELRDHELKAIADIVINHRCAHSQVPARKAILHRYLSLEDVRACCLCDLMCQSIILQRSSSEDLLVDIEAHQSLVECTAVASEPQHDCDGRASGN